MLGLERPPSSCARVTTVIATTLAACLIAACSGRAGRDAVTPLHTSDPRTSQAGATRIPGPTTDDHSPRVPAGGNRADSGQSGEDPDRVEVAGLLARFDSAISALYSDPLAAGDDNHPLSVDWLAVVLGGSQLDREVRGEILAAGRDDSIRIVPDPQGISFTDVAIKVTREADGSLTWTNCGYAPGVAVDLVSGEVRDDNRTSTRGRGRAIAGPDGESIISELWDDETYILEPGEADPCPGLLEGEGSPTTGGGR